MYGKGFRKRSVDNIIGELKELRDKYHFKSIMWWDDTFTINRKWLEEFCYKYKEEGFTAEMSANSRADLICNNELTIKRLSEIGLNWLAIGFETGTQRMLDFIKKGVTLEQNIKAADICRKYGIKVFGTFMLGLPTETKEEARATIEMYKKIAPDHGMIFYFTPIPGTEIYSYCVDNDLIIEGDELNIERTNTYTRNIKGIDYEYLEGLKQELLKDKSIKI